MTLKLQELCFPEIFVEQQKMIEKEELMVSQWKNIFAEAAQMGINFNLLAGGEPLLRKDNQHDLDELREFVKVLSCK